MPRTRTKPTLAEPLASAKAMPSADTARSVEGIAQDIASAIVEKRLPPGTRLKEEALCRVYTVSRTKVRAALLTLSKDKLIEIVPDKGAFVSRPTVQEAREVFALRRLLEAEVVRLFIEVATEREFEALEQHIQFERNALREPATMGRVREALLGDFHVVLADGTGNLTLATLVRDLVARSSLIAMLYHSSNNSQCSSDEHGEFLKLCRRRKVSEAVASMTDHLQRIEASLNLSTEGPDRQLDLVRALLT
jgi:DNA-binding GntR family transcriptional regulator